MKAVLFNVWTMQASECLKGVALLHRTGPAQKLGLVIQDGYPFFMFKGAHTNYIGLVLQYLVHCNSSIAVLYIVT